MPIDTLDLARRAVACTATGLHTSLPLFRYLPGMLAQSSLDSYHPAYHAPGRVIRAGYATATIYVPYGEIGYGERPTCVDELLPDFDDELTRLGMLALVRAAWDDADASARYQRRDDPAKCWICYAGGHMFYGATELAAFVATLEAAPVAVQVSDV